MLKNKSARRFLSVLLVLVGAALIFLATEAWAGALLVMLGVIIELIGIGIENNKGDTVVIYLPPCHYHHWMILKTAIAHEMPAYSISRVTVSPDLIA